MRKVDAKNELQWMVTIVASDETEVEFFDTEAEALAYAKEDEENYNDEPAARYVSKVTYQGGRES